MVVVENRVGVLGEEEMEEAARKDFQEEPGMMERCPFSQFIIGFLPPAKNHILIIVFHQRKLSFSAISELSAWISATPHLSQV